MSNNENPQSFSIQKQEAIISKDSISKNCEEKENLFVADHNRGLLQEEIVEKNNSDEKPRNSIDENDDGFKTPILDHKIPKIMECPPAPRKTRRKLKRKVSFVLVPVACRRNPFVDSAEIEAFFQQVEEERKIKKAKGDAEK